jgi:hypothetical protein
MKANAHFRWPLAVAAAVVLSTTTNAPSRAAANIFAEPARVIWDDDCGSDLDCVYSLTALHRLIASGDVRVLAFIVDSPSPYAAPVFEVWNRLWSHSVPVGSYRGTVGRQGAASEWSRAIRDKYRPGDVSARYQDCRQVYRRALATAPDHSIRLIETGFPTCLAALMRTPPDAISRLSGRELLKRKVQALFVMGGDYPGPADEFNFKTAAGDSSFLFRHWTKDAGYPPIYLNGFTPGSRLALGSTADSPVSAAISIAEKAAGETARPVWDLISVHQGVAGTSTYAVSPDGTNSVGSNGRNFWTNTRRSGHYYSTTKPGVDYRKALAAIIDGP